MQDGESNRIERVIVSEVSRISRSVRDFSASVERIVDENGVGLHVLDREIDLDSDERDLYIHAFLTVGRRSPNSKPKLNARTPRRDSRYARAWQVARATVLGFDVGSEGYLTPNDDYETALAVIDELDKGTSKRQLARRTGISRMTVMRINENRERYLSER